MSPILLCWPMMFSGYWWLDSKDWTFLPVFHHILLACHRWQQMGSLRKWRWRGSAYESKVLNSSIWKKWHPPIFFSACRLFMETKRWVWAQWKLDYVGSIFPSNDTIIAAIKQWVTSALMFRSTACRLLFIADKNTELMVVTMLKNRVLKLRFCMGIARSQPEPLTEHQVRRHG